MTSESQFVVETTDSTFETEVLERSRTTPVVVDFWAEWCGPCRLLGPVLEKLATEYAGRFLLAKANTDEAQRTAAAFGVRSIPAVFAVRDGQIVDSFVGALPESAARAWIERILPTAAETALAEARALEATDAHTAEARYRAALASDPELAPARIGLARTLVARSHDEEARALVAELERRGFLEPEAETLKATLDLRAQARSAGGAAHAREALAGSPDDPGLKLKLAEALAAEGRHEEALALCLELVEAGRKPASEDARKAMLNIFQVLPPDSELAADYRRRLAAALF